MHTSAAVRRPAALIAAFAVAVAGCGSGASKDEPDLASLDTPPAIVYDDALAALWVDRSVVQRDLGNVEPVAAGGSSISATLVDGQGLRFETSGVSASGSSPSSMSSRTAEGVTRPVDHGGSRPREQGAAVRRSPSHCTAGVIPLEGGRAVASRSTISVRTAARSRRSSSETAPVERRGPSTSTRSLSSPVTRACTGLHREALEEHLFRAERRDLVARVLGAERHGRHDEARRGALVPHTLVSPCRRPQRSSSRSTLARRVRGANLQVSALTGGVWTSGTELGPTYGRRRTG